MSKPITGYYRPPEDVQHYRVSPEAFAYELFPAPVCDAPLLVWVHGGAWRFGNHRALGDSSTGRGRMRELFQRAGWAVASINYRYSHQGLFPAPLHDIKEAIRYFRARADTYGIAPDRIAVAGGSAGAHLGLLVGLTAEYSDPKISAYYEGEATSAHRQVSSTVAAVGSFYGVSDLRTLFADRPLAGFSTVHRDDDGAQWRLLGCEYPVPNELPEPTEHHRHGRAHRSALAGTRAECTRNWSLAHPLSLAEGTVPGVVYRHTPVFAAHGIGDSCVPYQQSLRLFTALRRRGTITKLVLVPEAEHADERCYSREVIDPFVEFMQCSIA